MPNILKYIKKFTNKFSLTILSCLVLIIASVSSFYLYSNVNSNAEGTALFPKFSYGVNVEQQNFDNSNSQLVSGPWLFTNNEQSTMNFLRKFDQPNNQSKIPYVNMYVLAGAIKAQTGATDCNVGDYNKSLCKVGANYLRNNYRKVGEYYAKYTQDIKNVFGTDRPIMLHVEPDFYQYHESSQNGGGISATEASALMNSWTDTIKSILPNASLVLDISPWNSDLSKWSSSMRNFDYAGLVGKRFDPNGDGSVSAGIDGKTYSSISKMTGKKLIINDGLCCGVSISYNANWENRDLIQRRWNDGIVAVLASDQGVDKASKMSYSLSQNPIPSGGGVQLSSNSLNSTISSLATNQSSLRSHISSLVSSSSQSIISSSTSNTSVSSVIRSSSSKSVSSSSVIKPSSISVSSLSRSTISSSENISYAKSSKLANGNQVCVVNQTEFTLKKDSSWNTGYITKISVKNLGSQPLKKWTMNAFLANNQTLSNSWNIDTQSFPNSLKVNPSADWNRTITPNQQLEVGGMIMNIVGNSNLPSFDCSSMR